MFQYKIRDKALLIKASIAISFVVIVFFLHSIPELSKSSFFFITCINDHIGDIRLAFSSR